MKFLASTIFACAAFAQMSERPEPKLVDTPEGYDKCTAEQLASKNKTKSAQFNQEDLMKCVQTHVDPFCESGKCKAFPNINSICNQAGGEEKQCYEYNDEASCPKDQCVYANYCTRKDECNVIKDENDCQNIASCEFKYSSCIRRECFKLDTKEQCEGATWGNCEWDCVTRGSMVGTEHVQFYARDCRETSQGKSIMHTFMGGLDDKQLQHFCGDGCGQSTVDLLGPYIDCMPKDLVQSSGIPPVENIAGTMNHLCAKDSQDKYCAHAYFELQNTFTRKDCSQFKNLGCCLGSINEGYKLLSPEWKIKFATEMERCGIKSPPKACPIAGETQVSVVATATLNGLSSTKVLELSKADLEKLKEEVIKGIAEQSGLDPEDIQVTFEKAASDIENQVKAVIIMVPKDGSKVTSLAGDNDLLSKVDTEKVKEAAGNAVSGDMTTKVETVAKKENSNTAPVLLDNAKASTTAAAKASTIAAAGASTTAVAEVSASALIGISLVASVVSLFA